METVIEQAAIRVYLDERLPSTVRMRVHRDGPSYMGSRIGDNTGRIVERRERTEWDELFGGLYDVAKTEGHKGDKLRRYLLDALEDNGYDNPKEQPENFVSRKLYNAAAARDNRIRRFRRKRDLVRWTWWLTVTYDSAKCPDNETFERRFRRLMGNLSDRHGWKFAGGFEDGAENGRRHYHGFVYVPPGESLGEPVPKQSYSLREHKLHRFDEHPYFAARLGRNECVNLADATDIEMDKMCNYIAKYIIKSNDRLHYSRGIPDSVEMELPSECLAFGFEIKMKHPVKVYALFPDDLRREAIGLSYCPPAADLLDYGRRRDRITC